MTYRNNPVRLIPGVIFFIAVSSPVSAASQAMLDLLELLRDKGSISQDEYELLRSTAMAEEEKNREEETDQKKEVEETRVSMKDAGWTDKVKVKGDIRLRYQHDNADGSVTRDRGRVRYRLGVIARPADKLEVGAGLASGSDDQRSTNQSFDESFSTKNIGLDYAYAQYEFTDSFKAVGGKFKYGDYLWRPTDLIWDSDINPEGASANLTLKNRPGATFLSGGVWVLEEDGNSHDDPYLMYAQMGQKWQHGNLFGTVAGSYYNYSGITGLGALSKSAGTNTDFRFDSFGLSGELGIRDVFGGNSKASILVDYINNIDTGTPANTGYAIGFKAARSKWGFKYIYADLEANAWPDFLPDSDRFEGLTGIRGHEFAITYDIIKNVELGLDYYAAESTVTGFDHDLLQADMIIKF